MATDQTELLEIRLEEERYCVDIATVTEIVGRAELSSVPNAPAYVLGVMDYRGESLRVVDPKAVFGVEGEPDGRRIVVFDRAYGEAGDRTGWLVDEVQDVVSATDDEIDVDLVGTGVRGAVRPDGRLVVWVDPVAVYG